MSLRRKSPHLNLEPIRTKTFIVVSLTNGKSRVCYLVKGQRSSVAVAKGTTQEYDPLLKKSAVPSNSASAALLSNQRLSDFLSVCGLYQVLLHCVLVIVCSKYRLLYCICLSALYDNQKKENCCLYIFSVVKMEPNLKVIDDEYIFYVKII